MKPPSTKPKIALVTCPIYSEFYPNLALATLQADFKNKGFTTKVFDFSLEFSRKHPFQFWLYKKLHYILSRTVFLWNFLKPFYNSYMDKMIGIVKSFKPDYIGISMYESNVLQSVIFTNKIKKIMPNVKIIFGGPGGSIDRFRKYIRDNSKTNHIVLGEGEHALLNIITGKDEKQGLKNINEEPCPDYSGLINKKTKALAYYTTKGCFNDCVFCFESSFFKSFRAKNAKKVFNDIQILKNKYGISMFSFTDSVMFGSKINVTKFCDLVIKNNLNITWSGRITCDYVDKPTIRKMAKAGCIGVNLGLESGSEKLRTIMKKTSNLDTIINVLTEAKNQGIKVSTNFIVGFPKEGWKEFFESILLLKKYRKIFYSVNGNRLAVLEGTPLFNENEKFGIKNKRSIFWYSEHSNFAKRLIKAFIVNFFWKILKTINIVEEYFLHR